KLAFELLDRTRERRLRHVALFRRAREVQFLRDRKKIADLMHFHDALTCKVDRGPVAEVVGIGFAYSPGRIIRSKTCNQNNGVFLQCSNHAAECLLGVLVVLIRYRSSGAENCFMSAMPRKRRLAGRASPVLVGQGPTPRKVEAESPRAPISDAVAACVRHITLFAPKSYGNLGNVWAFADQRGGDLLMIRRRDFIA